MVKMTSLYVLTMKTCSLTENNVNVWEATSCPKEKNYNLLSFVKLFVQIKEIPPEDSLMLL